MKSVSLPAVAVEPELRDEIAHLLDPGESMDDFVEGAVVDRLRQRKEARAAFIARGVESLEEARRSGVYVPSADVLKHLDDKLEEARRRLAAKSR